MDPCVFVGGVLGHYQEYSCRKSPGSDRIKQNRLKRATQTDTFGANPRNKFLARHEPDKNRKIAQYLSFS